MDLQTDVFDDTWCEFSLEFVWFCVPIVLTRGKRKCSPIMPNWFSNKVTISLSRVSTFSTKSALNPDWQTPQVSQYGAQWCLEEKSELQWSFVLILLHLIHTQGALKSDTSSTTTLPFSTSLLMNSGQETFSYCDAAASASSGASTNLASRQKSKQSAKLEKPVWTPVSRIDLFA